MTTFDIAVRCSGRSRHPTYSVAVNGWQLAGLEPSELRLQLDCVAGGLLRIVVAATPDERGFDEGVREVASASALAPPGSSLVRDAVNCLSAAAVARRECESLYGARRLQAGVVTIDASARAAVGSLDSLPIHLYDAGFAARVDPAARSPMGEIEIGPGSVREIGLSARQRFLISTLDLEALGLDLAWAPAVSQLSTDWLSAIAIDVERRYRGAFCLMALQPVAPSTR